VVREEDAKPGGDWENSQRQHCDEKARPDDLAPRVVANPGIHHTGGAGYPNDGADNDASSGQPSPVGSLILQN
jgi:hypothetical protein